MDVVPKKKFKPPFDHIRVFIKGHLSFSLHGENFEFKNRAISLFGAYGLPWGSLSPDKDFGRKVDLKIRIDEPQVDIQTPASLTREQGINADHMGTKFHLEKTSDQLLRQIIGEHGFYPTDYLRKYPRIPVDQSIQTFPLRVMALPPHLGSSIEEEDHFRIIFEVKNISINGILISTENPFAASIQPGTHLHLMIEPRGEFLLPVKVVGLVCRLLEEKNPESGNMTRHFGVKFVQVDTENQIAFTELLKDVLEKIKTRLSLPHEEQE